MKFLFILFASSLVVFAEDYVYGPNSSEQANVPRGKVIDFTLKQSKIFPGTIRSYSIYVPAQYKGEPAALMVFQDGHAFLKKTGSFRATTVMDNLIHQKKMPITIGVFIDPGYKRATLPEKRGWKPRPENRSVEYDTLGDRYARFLIEEIIPKVAEKYTLSDDPDQRAIAGTSSGAICAWTVAWERPDYFRKVLSFIGSYTNIRGGHVYPAMIRQEEVKPIRIFLQDGANDLDNKFGNWPLANQQMAKSLAFAKYDYKFVFGTGGHSGLHGGTILPEAMQWLWRPLEKAQKK
jgi:enterochelin esterase-like enzyme